MGKKKKKNSQKLGSQSYAATNPDVEIDSTSTEVESQIDDSNSIIDGTTSEEEISMMKESGVSIAGTAKNNTRVGASNSQIMESESESVDASIPSTHLTYIPETSDLEIHEKIQSPEWITNHPRNRKRQNANDILEGETAQEQSKPKNRKLEKNIGEEESIDPSYNVGSGAIPKKGNNHKSNQGAGEHVENFVGFSRAEAQDSFLLSQQRQIMLDQSKGNGGLNEAGAWSNMSQESVIMGNQMCRTASMERQLLETDETKKEYVIIIEPLGSDIICKRFIGSDIKTARDLHKSNFGLSGIKQVSKNNKKGHLVVEMNPINIRKRDDLLKTELIGETSVKCRLPFTSTHSIGVIGPFGPHTTDSEISQELEENGYTCLDVKRLTKGKNKMPTAFFKIILETEELPNHIYMGYQRFTVKNYIEKPWQCYNCQGFGHNSKDCKAKAPRCVVCSGAHNYKNCTAENTKCVNCKGNHAASYGGCPLMKKERLINEIKANKKVDYNEAKRQVQTMERATESEQSPETSNTQASGLHGSSQNTEVKSPIMNKNNLPETTGNAGHNPSKKIIYHEMSTQTEEDVDDEITQDNKKSDKIPKWAAFMLQVLVIRDIDDQEEKCNALVKTLSVILGVEAPAAEVKKYLTPPINKKYKTRKRNAPQSKWIG